MELRKKYDQLRNQRGYTIDQTILIVAVIAILITMIIVSVGWDILTRAGGTKLASHLKQFEQANGQFFAANAAWPHEAVAGGAAGGVVACALLGDTGALSAPYDGTTGMYRPKNYLPGYTCTGGATVKHGFGAGGDVLVELAPAATNGMGQDYLKVTMVNVPRTEAASAKKDIDGDGTPDDEGRLRIDGATKGGGSTVTVEYLATAIN